MTPVLRQVARQIHPYWFFRATLVSVTLASWFWPHTRKSSRPFSTALAQRFDQRELRKRITHYLLYLRLFKDLVPAWTNWEYRHRDWVSVEGEDYLEGALERDRGVVLISGHNYGFGKLVAPALAVRGYKVNRVTNGKKGMAEARWRRRQALKHWHCHSKCKSPCRWSSTGYRP